MELLLLVGMYFVEGVGVNQQILRNCCYLLACSLCRRVGVNYKSCGTAVACGHVLCGWNLCK